MSKDILHGYIPDQLSDRIASSGWDGFLAGSIVAQFNQPEAKGHSFGIIEMKKSSCSASTCGNAFNQSAIEAKMAAPSLLTWMKEEGGLQV